MNESRVLKSWRYGVATVALMLATLSVGCTSTETVHRKRTGPPLPVFRGENFLYGTVGSMASLRSSKPTLVSGYGLVILPKGSGTGSSDVPNYLRQWFLNEMRRKGVGRFEFGAQDLSPRQLLMSKDTAVVRVEGLIPAGSPKGIRFPVLVSALENTQTTNLEGGSLWTTDLSISGNQIVNTFSKPLATAKGDVYINPFDAEESAENKLKFQRQGVIIAGGFVQKDRPIELLLNQPDYNRSKMIADRINERFPHEKAAEFFNTAVARSDLQIRINIPDRYSQNPQRFMDLVAHLFIQRTPNFEEAQAQRLGDHLMTHPQHAADVSLGWQALGKLSLPIVRKYYITGSDITRLAALDAGSALQDEMAAIELQKMSLDANKDVRVRVAQMLAQMPRSQRAGRTLMSLVDDPEIKVRVSAYRALVASGSSAITRMAVGDSSNFKFYLDIVQAKDPLVYVSQEKEPRLVIFSPNTGFKDYTRAAIWDGRLRLDGGTAREPMRVFYQAAAERDGNAQKIAPTVANLAFLMGHRPTAAKPIEGFDLSYGTVINAIYNLQKQGHVEAPMRIGENPLAKALEEARNRNDADVRPEVAPVDGPTEATTSNEIPRDLPSDNVRPTSAPGSSSAPAGNDPYAALRNGNVRRESSDD